MPRSRKNPHLGPSVDVWFAEEEVRTPGFIAACDNAVAVGLAKRPDAVPRLLRFIRKLNRELTRLRSVERPSRRGIAAKR